MQSSIEERDRTALADSVALITGGSRGIGLAIAKRLGRMGARVAICGRDESRLKSATRELPGPGTAMLAIPADVREPAAVENLVRRVYAELGPIDILINNAGIGIFGPLHERTETEWDDVLNTNLKSVFLLSRAVVPEMIRRHRGHIINIASLAGKNTFANGGVYCASKWGLLGLSGCMAEELRAHGIRVSTICPGSVATEFSAHAGRPADLMLQPEDVAHAVAMLLTEGSHSFISSVDLRPRQKS